LTTDDHGRERLVFRYSGLHGVVRKSLVFRCDGLIDVEIGVEGNVRWGLVLGPGIRNACSREVEDRFARRSGVFLQGSEVETIDSQGAEEPALIPGRGLVWVGLQDAYFLSVVLPADPIESAVFLPVLVRVEDGLNVFDPVTGELSGDDEDLTRELELVAYPGAETFVGSAYMGAKKYDRLSEIGYSLERTVSLGFFSFLARPLLWALLWIYDHVVANYGWAIVLLTFLVRLVLFPLTHKSTVSMRRMQALNPQIQAIRQKYRAKLKDKKGRPNAEAQRKMNEEIMGLYKKEGVNPAGGCLPLLLQMPVLFAFYSLLSAAVELRGAPWILWIQDLSAPDPYFVLPIVMGASQYVQQKLMPAGGDPTQRKIMMLMPAFFTILFLKFASGLVLYWLTSNLLTIAQTAITNRLLDDGAAAEPSAGRA
jgi:YidC/Oxa1 family membrane protein insertase